MGKANALVHALNAGEVSRAAMARVDLEQAKLFAERQENLFPYVIGKAIQRPGTKKLASSAYGWVSIIPFVKTLSETALLEFGFTALAAGTLRVYVDDELVTRNAVSATISDPTFVTGTGWTTASASGGPSWGGGVTGGGATVSFSGALVMQAAPLGSYAAVYQHVTNASANVEHALRIVVGGNVPVTFQCGSTLGGSDYIETTDLRPGTHSLAFTPTGADVYVHFQTSLPVDVTVNSISFEDAGIMVLPAPWSTVQGIQQVRYTQSVDVVYLSFSVEDSDASLPQMQIEHRGPHSWSICNYLTNDGPFTVAPTASGATFTPGANVGNTTLTSNLAFFNNDHVGALFQLTHDSYNYTVSMGAQGNVFATTAFRVTGIQASGDRAWSYTVSGTWAGTIRVQRSFDGQFSGFHDYTTVVDITSNGTGTVNDADDNAISWYRFVFITYTSGAPVINISYPAWGFSGVCRVTSVNSPTSANIEVLSDLANIVATAEWLQGEWCPDRRYPTAVCEFDGRLWWAREDQFWASVSDSYYSFATELVGVSSSTAVSGDSSSIQRNIATDSQFQEVRWMLGLQRLVFGTTGAEVTARAPSLDEALTPTNISLKDSSGQGSANTAALKVDKVGIFLQKSTHKLYAMQYDIYASDYTPHNLMRVNEDIGYCTGVPFPTTPGTYPTPAVQVIDSTAIGFVKIVLQRQPETYVWGIRNDGQLCILIYEPQEKVQGWFRMTTDTDRYLDDITDVCVIPGSGEDAIYQVAARWNPSGGSYEVSFIVEKLGAFWDTVQRFTDGTRQQAITQVDSYVTANADGVNLLTISGLDHLEGRSVMALGFSVATKIYGPLEAADGTTRFTVSGGQITLGEIANGTVCAGLPYAGFYKTAKLAYGAQGGTALLQPKNVSTLGLLLSDTHPDALLTGTDFDGIETMDPMPRIEDGLPVVLTQLAAVYDKKPFPIPGSWDTDSRVCIKVQPGYAATIDAFVMAVETNEQLS